MKKGFENMFTAIFLFLFVIVIFGYMTIYKEKIPATTVEKTGCAGDNSKCDYPETPGKLCIRTDDPNTKEKIEYACGCVGNDDCPNGKICVKEGKSYGSCK